MKNKIHAIALAALVLCIFSCSREKREQTEPASQAKHSYDVNAYCVSSTDSTTLEGYLDVLKLGLIDLASNTDVVTTINSYIYQESYSDYTTLYELKTRLNGVVDLKMLMAQSVLNHGGTDVQAALVESLVDSFTLSDTIYQPVIYIPYSDEINLNQDPLIGKGWVNVRSSLALTDYFDSNTPHNVIDINASDYSIVQSRPTWLLNFVKRRGGVTIDNAWFLGNRCYCNRGQLVQSPEGNWQVLGQGICDANKNQQNCGKCSRANWNGNCPGSPCAGC